MIKINLLQEAKTQRKASFRPKIQGVGDTFHNLIMVGVVVLSLLFISYRWVTLEIEDGAKKSRGFPLKTSFQFFQQ